METRFAQSSSSVAFRLTCPRRKLYAADVQTLHRNIHPAETLQSRRYRELLRAEPPPTPEVGEGEEAGDRQLDTNWSDWDLA